MKGPKFKDLVSHTGLAGIVVESKFLKQKEAGSSCLIFLSLNLLNFLLPKNVLYEGLLSQASNICKRQKVHTVIIDTDYLPICNFGQNFSRFRSIHNCGQAIRLSVKNLH